VGHREQLLEGAKRCLLERGYARTTARDIVAASGTNLASIGYHFGSKEALLNAAVIEVIGDWGEGFADSLPTELREGALEQLRAMLTSYIETMNSQRPLFAASFEAFAFSERVPELREQFAAAYELSRESLPGMVPQVAAATDDDAERRAVGSVLLSLIAGVSLQWLVDPERAPSGDEIARGLRRIAEFVAE
jgi:AcrR family transcriptional regulator